MPTQHISNYTVVDARDTARLLTFTVFTSLEEARAWVRFREAELYEAVKNDAIGGTFYKEERIPAKFIATSRDALDYLGFGARVVETVYVEGLPALIIGIPRAHVQWLSLRLHSGLVRHAGPYDDLETAIAHAPEGL